MPDRIYLDHASTTPILPQAAAAMADACRSWANPSSPHAEGRAVRAQLEGARRRIAAALETDSTLIFTSGATEAISLVFERARAKARIVSAVEHPAVLRSAPDARRIAVHPDGMLDLDDLDRALEGAEAIRRLASSSCERTARPSAWGEDGLAQLRQASAIAAAACGRIGVVEAWSR